MGRGRRRERERVRERESEHTHMGERERERERERECMHLGDRVHEKALWLLLLYVFSSTWAALRKLGLARSAVCSA